MVGWKGAGVVDFLDALVEKDRGGAWVCHDCLFDGSAMVEEVEPVASNEFVEEQKCGGKCLVAFVFGVSVGG